jgi:hypothetical protein
MLVEHYGGDHEIYNIKISYILNDMLITSTS